MTPDEERIQTEASIWARTNKKKLARELTDITRFPPEQEPVAVFMAGSPGAGKTETAEAMLEDVGNNVILIDPDRYRSYFEAYDGTNAWLFQTAVSIIVEKVLDLAFKNNQSFILDGTLTNYGKAKSNIERSLGRNRLVQIIYVYQSPLLAWRFVEAREASEGRRIRPQDFLDQYFEARNVVNRLKRRFGNKIKVDLIVKNMDNSMRSYKINVDVIDRHVPEKYTRADIARALNIPETLP